MATAAPVTTDCDERLCEVCLKNNNGRSVDTIPTATMQCVDSDQLLCDIVVDVTRITS